MKGKGDNLIILKPTSGDRKQGGLIIPPSSTDDFFEAVILDAGISGEDWGIEAGERVLVRNVMSRIKIGKRRGEGDIYVVEYEDILCAIENDEDASSLL